MANHQTQVFILHLGSQQSIGPCDLRVMWATACESLDIAVSRRPPGHGNHTGRPCFGLWAGREFHRAPAQGNKTFEVCYASQNEAFLLNVERGQALILITDYVYDTDGRPLHVSKRIQRTDRAKYTEPIG